MSARKQRPAPKQRTRRGPKIDPAKKATATEGFDALRDAMRYWRETEAKRHP